MARITFDAEPFAANIAGVAVNVDPSALPAESLAFAFAYGLRQYVQDGAAVDTTLRDENGEPMLDASGRKRRRDSDEIAAEKADGVNARVANLLSGEFTRRSAGRVTDPTEKERNAYLDSVLRPYFKSQGKKFPTGEDLVAARAKVYAANGEKVDKEVARRMREAEKVTFDVPADI